jgi:hypothetical protein
MDEFSIGALGMKALSDGIAFLYTQAGELLRKHRDNKADSERPDLPAFDPPVGLFEGLPEAPLEADAHSLELVSDQLRDARKRLSPFADGTEPVDPNSTTMILALQQVRLLLQDVYQHELRFPNEKASPLSTTAENYGKSGVVAAGNIKAKYIAGHNLTIGGSGERKRPKS